MKRVLFRTSQLGIDLHRWTRYEVRTIRALNEKFEISKATNLFYGRREIRGRRVAVRALQRKTPLCGYKVFKTYRAVMEVVQNSSRKWPKMFSF